MNKPLILIIDDELPIRRMLTITLESHEFRVAEASASREGLALAANHPPDLILLDIGLPDGNGQEVLRRLREWYSKPIVMLSVQSDEENIVQALDNGANDYLVKPFRTGELLARIRTALRNVQPAEQKPVNEYGALQIDFSARTVKLRGAEVHLTVTEYNLLALMARHEGKVLTHQFLLREIWGPGYVNQTQYLRVFLAQLRKKIETDPNQPAMLRTEPGVGYRFVTPG